MSKYFFTILFAILVSVTGYGQKSWQQDELFTVNGRVVTADEFIYVYQKNNQNNDSAYTKTDINDYFDLYKNFKLKVEEAYHLGVDTSKAFLEEFNQYKKEFIKPFLSEQKALENLIAEAYERMQSEVSASHILISVNDFQNPDDTLKAYQLIDSLREIAIENPENFEQLAKKHSQDPSARQNEGDLGYFSAMQMLYPFENAAYQTPVGEISEIIKTSYGYHILKVNDTRPAKGTYKLAHIMLRFPRGANSDSYGAAKIKEIHAQLNGGANWEDLTAQFSTDARTKNQGGELPPLQFGQLPPSFRPVVDKLTPGEYSQPFTSPYGWHIVKLIDIEPIKPLEDLRPRLTQQIESDPRSQIKKEEIIDNLKTRFGYQLNEQQYDLLKQRADTTLSAGNWQVLDDETLRSEDLLKIDGNWSSTGEFLDFVDLKQRPLPNRKPLEIFEIFFDQYVEKLLLDYEADQLAKNNRDFRQLMREYKEGLMLFEVMEANVWAKAIEDSAGLQAFYQQNRDQYLYDTRVEAVVYNMKDSSFLDKLKKEAGRENYIILDTVISLVDKNEVDKLIKESSPLFRQYEGMKINLKYGDSINVEPVIEQFIQKGAAKSSINLQQDDAMGNKLKITLSGNSKKLLEHTFNQESALTLQVNEGLFEKDDLSVLKKVSLSPGDTTLTMNGRFYWVDIKKVLEPSVKPLSETKGKVISDYQAELERQWIEKLKEKYPIKVDRKTLKKTVEYLEN